jgi:hypothetical protein
MVTQYINICLHDAALNYLPAYIYSSYNCCSHKFVVVIPTTKVGAAYLRQPVPDDDYVAGRATLCTYDVI